MTTCVAIFGITGGSGKWTAFHLLSAPDLPGGVPRYRVRALVRSPSKVQAWTEPEWTTTGQSGSDLKSRLELVQGNARDPKTVAECLQGASTLISTVGASPVWKGLGFTLDDPTICQDVMKVVLSSVQHPAPRIVFISTTGLTPDMSDVPWLLRPLYHWMLHVPHQDKRQAEHLLQASTSVTEKIVVRAALLTNGKARGWGTAADSVASSHCVAQEGRSRGYTISRRDVGDFVANQAVTGAQWVNKEVVISN